MLTFDELATLERSLRGTTVLSVYIDGEVRDPARRSAWRTPLKNELARIRKALRGATHTEREGYRHAVELLRGALRRGDVALGTPGWMGFVTPRRVHLAAPLPVRVPTDARWGEGIRIAPAIRALKEARPVIVAIVDSRSARVYRYVGASLEMSDHLHAVAHLEPPSHMGTAPRRGFHTGTRGRTGAEAAERGLRAGRERMMRELAERVTELAGGEGWVLVGGTPGAAREALAALPAQVVPRAEIVAELPIRSTEAEVARHAAGRASLLRRAEDLRLVREVVERAGAGGLGVLGLAGTRQALESGAAQRLYFTLRLLEDAAAEADVILRLALDHDVRLEEVSGDGAALLDAQGGGIGAALHYAMATPERAVPAGLIAARGRGVMPAARRRPLVRQEAAMPTGKKTAAGTTSRARRESGTPGGGQGRRDIVGESRVYPASAGRTPRGEAEVRTMAAWGQGARGAAGYEDSGGSELVLRGGELLGGLTAGPSGEPTMDIHGGDVPRGLRGRGAAKTAKRPAKKPLRGGKR